MHVSLKIGVQRKKFSLRLWIASRLIQLAEWVLNPRREEREAL